jgi:hypothetical protein
LPGQPGFLFFEIIRSMLKALFTFPGSRRCRRPPGAGTRRDRSRGAGRPVLFSICEWGDNKPWEWAGDVGDSSVDFGRKRHRFTDLWAGEQGDTGKPFAMTVSAHGAVMLRLSPD